MYKVSDGNVTKYFCKEEDAKNYEDFFKNGLKVVRKSCGGWLFNDGTVLFDVSLTENMKKYVLKKENRSYTSLKFQKKYIEVLENYLK